MDVEELTRRRPVLCLGFCAILLLLCYLAALLGGSARLATLFGMLCWAVVVLAYVFTPAGLYGSRITPTDRSRLCDELTVAHRHTASMAGLAVTLALTAGVAIAGALGVEMVAAHVVAIPVLTLGVLSTGVVWAVLELRAESDA